MNKGFYVEQLNIGNIIYYYIVIQNNYIHRSVCDISNILDMSIENYKNLIISYGAIETKYGFIFKNIYDIYDCINYLNSKYLVLLKLANKI